MVNKSFEYLAVCLSILIFQFGYARKQSRTYVTLPSHPIHVEAVLPYNWTIDRRIYDPNDVPTENGFVEDAMTTALCCDDENNCAIYKNGQTLTGYWEKYFVCDNRQLHIFAVDSFSHLHYLTACAETKRYIRPHTKAKFHEQLDTLHAFRVNDQHFAPEGNMFKVLWTLDDFYTYHERLNDSVATNADNKYWLSKATCLPVRTIPSCAGKNFTSILPTPTFLDFRVRGYTEYIMYCNGKRAFESTYATNNELRKNMQACETVSTQQRWPYYVQPYNESSPLASKAYRGPFFSFQKGFMFALGDLTFESKNLILIPVTSKAKAFNLTEKNWNWSDLYRLTCASTWGV